MLEYGTTTTLKVNEKLYFWYVIQTLKTAIPTSYAV